MQHHQVTRRQFVIPSRHASKLLQAINQALRTPTRTTATSTLDTPLAEQLLEDRDLVTLTTRQDKRDGLAVTLCPHVRFGAEAPS